MSLVYLFNPEHDLALSNGEPNYLPPDTVKQMASDLALLPMWYAEPGSFILASSAYNQSFLEVNKQLFNIDVSLITEVELLDEGGCEFIPWGWNLALHSRLSRLSGDDSTLPSVEQLSAWRNLSHRKQAVRVLASLNLGDDFCGESFYLTTIESCCLFVEDHDISLLKSPLSGSGKGLNWCKGRFTPSISGWCNRIIRQHGGVIGEPVYDKIQDFAMEFLANAEGEVSFMGYSWFDTTKSGAYTSNLLLSDEAIEQRLAAYVPLSQLRLLQSALEKELSTLLEGSYVGYLGVDMMICFFDQSYSYRLHPCVEINLRMNMGIVARLFTDRYVTPGAEGVFGITYYAADGEALSEHQSLKKQYPLEIESGAIRLGYLSLTPITTKTHYRAWVLVK